MFKRELIFLFLFFGNIFAFDLSKISTFQANFTQIINSDNKELIYRGEIFAKKEPNNVRWNYIYPLEKQVFIFAKKTILIEPELEQVTIRNLDQEIPFFDILNKAEQIDNNHYVALLNDYKFFLVLKNNQISRIFYKDSFDNDVSIKLSDVKINSPFDKNIFTVEFSEDFDVINDSQ